MENNLFTKLFSDLQEAAKESKQEIFFTEDNTQGYFSKSDFADFLLKAKGLGKINHLKQFFDNISVGRTLANFPKLEEENGNPFSWCTFKSGRVKQSLNVYADGRMFDFIKDYADGKFKFPFTLETLIEQADETKAEPMEE
ncbi:hypothetical protein MUY27_13905 [Mucilaginibacter sp. RS28]|uniref:Uncharacterized protein n=1 Tax=Mucilaginibacter straminoryzae TaxID=2932774 RepID=A0A9X1X481_9SPHI|nr:hypothetical protein [Mucilaginibacter straminoryzae]MCJ8210807.1 hypothetical protein [Mucilaginibacter straminoryzae]